MLRPANRIFYAEHSDILNRFAALPQTEQNYYIDGAKMVNSRKEMKGYVETMFEERNSIS